MLENGRQGLNLTWEVRDGIARHSKGKHGLPVGAPPEHRASTIEGQIARVADICAYVNHDIDDAVRAEILRRSSDLPASAIAVLGQTSSQRINTMVTDVVMQTLEGDLSEVRMSDEILSGDARAAEFPVRSRLREPARDGRVREGTSASWAACGTSCERVPSPISTRPRSTPKGSTQRLATFLPA